MKEEGKLNTNEVNNDNPISNTDWSYDFDFSEKVKDEVPAAAVVETISPVHPQGLSIEQGPVQTVVVQPEQAPIFALPTEAAPVTPIVETVQVEQTPTFVLPAEAAPVTPQEVKVPVEPTIVTPVVTNVTPSAVFVKPIVEQKEEILDEYEIKNEIVKEKTMNQKRKMFIFFVFAVIIAFIAFLPMIFQMTK